MQIVINIPDEKYERLVYLSDVDLKKYIKKGTPLPKGHGRLIDADVFKEDNKVFWNCDFIHPMYEETLADLVNSAPTVVEADKKRSRRCR